MLPSVQLVSTTPMAKQLNPLAMACMVTDYLSCGGGGGGVNHNYNCDVIIMM